MFTSDWYECCGWGFMHRKCWSFIIKEQTHCKKKFKPREFLSLCFGLSILIQSLLLLAGDIHSNPGPQGSDISICHVNIRSIRNQLKIDHINCALTDHYNIITLSETWLNQSIDVSKLCLNNFQQPFRRDRDNNSGYGGVLAWVANHIAAKRRRDLEIHDLEAMWLEVRAKNNKFLLCVVYRPPNTTYNFWDNLQESIDMAKDTNLCNIVITGDLNADPSTLNGRLLSQFADRNHLVLHIDKPTRITSDNRSILDQFMTNIPMFVRNLRVEAPVSTNDHCTIGMDLHFKLQPCKAYERLMWDFKNADFDNFRNQISNIDFNAIVDIEDVNEAAIQFTEEILRVSKACIPNKVVTVRPDDKPWFTNELRRLLRKKNRSHSQAKILNTPEQWGIFRAIRNKYYREIAKSKLQLKERQYENLISNNFLKEKNGGMF